MAARTLTGNGHEVSARVLRDVMRPWNSAGEPGSQAARHRTLRRWIIAWVGAPVLAIANGAARELAYKDQVGESTAHQISVAPLIALLGLYFWLLQRRWPLTTTRDAMWIGGTWVLLSVLFESGFGHYVEGDSWTELLESYDLTAGNLWTLVLLWTATGPAIVRELVD